MKWEIYTVKTFKICTLLNSVRIKVKADQLRPGRSQRERRHSSYSMLVDLGTTWREWSASRPTRERTPGTHWVGGWMGLRAGLGTTARGKILCLCRGSNLARRVCSLTLYWLSYSSSTLIKQLNKGGCRRTGHVDIGHWRTMLAGNRGCHTVSSRLGRGERGSW
jgi:hypothetical protein